MRTILLILAVSSTTVVSQLLLKKGVNDLGIGRLHVSVLADAVTSPLILASILLQMVSFSLWVLVLSRANLGYAFGISGAFFYLLLPFMSWFFFGERLTLIQWFGLVLITAGVICIVTRLEFLK